MRGARPPPPGSAGPPATAHGWPIRIDEHLAIGLYDARHRARFTALNLAWLERYFAVEPIDRRVLGDPEGEILDRGGDILFALLDGDAVGTVALKPYAAGVLELTKMAVAPELRGRGIGRRLLDAAILRARERGARALILYSNTLLEPAIALYRSVGFVEMPLDAADDRYVRSNIKMELMVT